MTSADYDLFIAAVCLFREARSGTMSQMNGVWWVINNRMNDAQNRWPKHAADVVLQPYQFSSFNATDPNTNKFATRKNAIDWDAFQRCMVVISNPLGDDPTSGANMYHTYPEGDPHWPSWADPTKLTIELGVFKFYKL